jgi:hypothetical protein
MPEQITINVSNSRVDCESQETGAEVFVVVIPYVYFFRKTKSALNRRQQHPRFFVVVACFHFSVLETISAASMLIVL